MARSFRKTAIIGISLCSSEKEDKRRANRTLRRKTKQVLITAETFPRIREVLNAWRFAKDGKSFFPGASLRK